jgi:hypothetical protein
MGQATHVAAGEAIYPSAHETPAPNGPVLTAEIQEPTMAPDYHNRRHTDRGYVPQFPSPATALRWAFGEPVTKSLSALSHWRRRPAAQQENGAAS